MSIPFSAGYIGGVLGMVMVAATATATATAVARPAAHDGHQSYNETAHEATALRSFPASGTVREAGFEGGHGMASTGLVNSKMKQRCDMARKGLVMLDRRTWVKCDRMQEKNSGHEEHDAMQRH